MFDRAKAFWVGFTGGFAGSLQLLSVSLYDLVFLFPLKLFAAVLLAFSTGIATMLANSMYEGLLKHKVEKLLKNKKELNSKNKEKETENENNS
jgi:hypothetical protein